MFDKKSYVDKETEIKIDESKRQQLLKKLKGRGLCDYDKTINIKDIEEITEREFKNESDKDWSFILLQLKDVLESESFFTTTRALNGGIRTLAMEEMPFYNEQQNKKAHAAMKWRQKSLYQINANLLHSEVAKKLEFELLRNGQLITEAYNQLKKRCS